MVALAWAVLLGFRPVSFTISHHVTLPEFLLSSHDVRRDGSLVGSIGDMGLHDGHQIPLIVRQGKPVKLANEDQVRPYEVGAALPNGQFEVLKDADPPRRAALRGRSLVLLGEMKKAPEQSGANWARASADPTINALFPVPPGMRDTTENESVYWFDYLQGMKLGMVQVSTHMEYGHRVALREAAGHTRAIEKCVPGLSKYEAHGIVYVSPQGWFVISAIRREASQDNGVTIGLGNELFWIEPHLSSTRPQ